MKKLTLFVCLDVEECDNPGDARDRLDDFRERTAEIAEELGLTFYQPAKADCETIRPYPENYVIKDK